jgi:hypothetical protein
VPEVLEKEEAMTNIDRRWLLRLGFAAFTLIILPGVVPRMAAVVQETNSPSQKRHMDADLVAFMKM